MGDPGGFLVRLEQMLVPPCLLPPVLEEPWCSSFHRQSLEPCIRALASGCGGCSAMWGGRGMGRTRVPVLLPLLPSPLGGLCNKLAGGGGLSVPGAPGSPSPFLVAAAGGPQRGAAYRAPPCLHTASSPCLPIRRPSCVKYLSLDSDSQSRVMSLTSFCKELVPK